MIGAETRARLRMQLDDGCQLCVVVKANGYGHAPCLLLRAGKPTGRGRRARGGRSCARPVSLRCLSSLWMGALSPVELCEALRVHAEVVVGAGQSKGGRRQGAREARQLQWKFWSMRDSGRGVKDR